MSCKIWLKKKFLSRLSPCTFFFLWTSKSPTTNSLSSGSSKVITSFSCQTSNWSPLFFRDFKKNPFESFGFEATFHFHLQVHHLQVHLPIRNFQGIEFFTLSPDCCFPFLELWPTLFPLGKNPNRQPGGPLFGDAGETSLHRAAFFGFQHKKKPKNLVRKQKWRRDFPSFFYPFLVEKNSRRKKANIHEFQRLFPCFRCLAPNPQVLPAIHPGGFRFRIRRQIRIESGASWGFLRSTIYTPGNSTWNLEMMVSNRNLLFQGAPIFRFHVCFGGAPTIRQCLFWFNLEKWHEMITFSLYYVNTNYPPWNLTDLTATIAPEAMDGWIFESESFWDSAFVCFGKGIYMVKLICFKLMICSQQVFFVV